MSPWQVARWFASGCTNLPLCISGLPLHWFCFEGRPLAFIGKTLPNRVVLEGAFNKSAVTHMIFNSTAEEMMGYFFND
eukprot:SAG11_NODE_20650_length_441_cov_0.739766_1_plen_77_part_10